MGSLCPVPALSGPAPERTNGAFLFNVSDLKTIKVKTEGWCRLTFCLKEHVTLPDLHFHQGGSDAFLDSLRGFLLLTQYVSEATSHTEVSGRTLMNGGGWL